MAAARLQLVVLLYGYILQLGNTGNVQQWCKSVPVLEVDFSQFFDHDVGFVS